MTAASLTRSAAQTAISIGRSHLPIAVCDKAVLCVQDVLASCIPAVAAADADPLLRLARAQGQPGPCYHIGLNKRLNAQAAAFGNAALAHLLIRDDMHVASGSHIGAIVVPAMVALGEQNGLSGRQVMTGIAAAYEAMARLGMALWSRAGQRHFRPSGIAGAFGVAAGGIAALGLDVAVGERALGIAANLASGLNQWPRSAGQEAVVHMGAAASNGLLAIDLAIAGLRPSPDILEGRDGMFAAFGAGSDAATRFADGLHDSREILRVRHKPVAGCNLIQSPVAAALDLRRCEAIDHRTIMAVTIRTFSLARDYPGCDWAGPFEGVQQSKMSLQFGVALALVRGDVDEQGYADLASPDVLHIARLCRIVVDDRFEKAAGATQPSEVEVALEDGRVLRQRCSDVPWLEDSRVRRRFESEASLRYGPTTAARLLEATGDLWSSTPILRLTDLIEEGETCRSPAEC